ncbi:MAG: hypothetical protein CL624_11520 [Arcobacter sp.]|nr:hypothetical protein [Arcobacter sp.]|tara:strand:+ start:4072 stop:5085 length:1014 start_codon:yes stop_codon:yes gene_type:complete
MKICQVLAGNEDGGLEKHTIELSKELKKRNFDITVIAHEKFKSEFDGIRFISFDLTKSRNNIFMLYKLYEILREEKFDIIHSQANKATSIVVKLKMFINSKIVSTLHSYKKNLSSFYKSDYVISVSNKIAENLNIKNKTTIYNGIKLENINNINLYDKYNIPKEKFIICSVGRLSFVKRFDVLISSLKYTDNVHLILVGEGKEESKLKKLATRLSLDKNITFTGNLNNLKAKEIIKSSNLFVMTSQKEGFPYTLIETLSCQTPIISTDVSDIKDIIGSDFIIEYDNNKALALKINDIKNDYEKTNSYFKPIYKQSQEKFTTKYMTNETINIYEKVLR